MDEQIQLWDSARYYTAARANFLIIFFFKFDFFFCSHIIFGELPWKNPYKIFLGSGIMNYFLFYCNFNSISEF